jgi:hypothetical protein
MVIKKMTTMDPPRVTLPLDLIGRCRSYGERMVSDVIGWNADSRAVRSTIDVEKFLAFREEAGRKIVPETAEVASWYAMEADPYGIRDLSEDMQQVGRVSYVRSPGGDIWVAFRDLPQATLDALYANDQGNLKLAQHRFFADHARRRNAASRAVSCFDAASNPELQALARMGECAICIYGGLSVETLNWDRCYDDGCDLVIGGKRVDVKHTRSGRYLIWPNPKNSLYEVKKFDVLALVIGDEHRGFELAGCVTKDELRRLHHVA